MKLKPGQVWQSANNFVCIITGLNKRTRRVTGVTLSKKQIEGTIENMTYETFLQKFPTQKFDFYSEIRKKKQ